MVESYTVQTTLSVKNELLAALQANMQAAGALAKEVNQLTQLLDNMGKLKPLAGMTSTLGNISKGFGIASAEAAKFESALSKAGVGAAALGPVINQTHALQSAINSATAAQKGLASAISSTPKQQGGAPGAPGAAGRTGARSHGGWGGVSMEMMVSGGMLEAFGHEMGEHLKGVYEAGAAYAQAFASFQALNLGDAINRDADRFANSTSVFGVSATELMTTLNSLHQTMGHYDEAKALTPFVAEMEFANQAVFHGKMNFDDAQAGAMGKVIEQRGGFKSEEEMKAQADFMQRVMSGTSGQVMPQQYLQFLKRGGIAATLMGNREFYFEMEPLIQELGGSTTGTGLNSAYQNLAQGRTTKKVAGELARLGLIDEKTMGRGMLPHGVLGGDMVGTDPLRFLREVLLPAFRAKGITEDKDIINELGAIFSNRTAASLYTKLYQQRDKIDKNIGIDERAMGVAGIEELARKTPEGALKGMEAAWTNFQKALSPSLMSTATNVMNSLTDTLNKLTAWAKENPELVELLLGFGEALAVIATVGGTLLLVGGAMGMLAGVLLSPIAGPIMAIVSALGILGVVSAHAHLKDPAAEKRKMNHGMRSEAGDEHAAGHTGSMLTDPRFGKAVGTYSGDYPGAEAGKLEKLESHSRMFREHQEWLAKMFGEALASVKKYLMEDLDEWREINFQVFKAIGDFGDKVKNGFQAMLDGLGNAILNMLKTMAMQYGIPPSAIDAVAGTNKIGPASPGSELAHKIADSGNLPWAMSWGLKAGANIADYFFGSSSGSAPAAAKAPEQFQDPSGFRAALHDGKPEKELTVRSQTPVNVQVDGHTLISFVLDGIMKQVGGPNTGPSLQDPFATHTPTGVALFGQAF